MNPTAADRIGPEAVTRRASRACPIAAALLPALLVSTVFAADTSSRADLVLVHGTVLTMDRGNTIAEAVAVAGDRIVGVGGTEAMKALAGPGARVIDLDGKTLLPGFIDSRIAGPLGFWELSFEASLTDSGGRPLGRPEAIETRLKEWLAAHRPAPYAWVVGAGFDPKLLASRSFNRDWADRLVPDNPLLLLSLDHHVALLNSRAVDLAGLKDLRYPDGSGEVARDAQGKPTGLVRELPVFLVLNQIWSLLPEETRRGATVRFLDAAGRAGLTTIGSPMMIPADLETVGALASSHELPARVVAGALRSNDGARRAFDAYRRDGKSPDPERLMVGPSFTLLDGTLFGWGAALFQVYRDSTWTSGFLSMSPDRIAQMVAGGADGDGGLLVEASGSLSVHLLLEAVERLSLDPARNHSLLRADGLQMLDPGDRERLSRAARAGLVVTVQPTRFPYQLIFKSSIGEDRVKEMMPCKALVDAGLPVAINSDWPMTAQTFRPTQILQLAVTRAGLNPEEGMTVAQALRAYTADAARALGVADRVGSIEVGKRADLVVLDGNPLDLAATPERLGEIPVRMTISGGTIVFEDRRVAAASAR